MSSALQYIPRYTVEDYRRWKGDWELWDGIAIAMSPSPFGRHQALAVALASEIRIALKATRCDATSLMELDWIVNDDTVVRPDVMVVCGEVPEKHQHVAPAIVAEVLSPSTKQNDLTYKRELYAREGVKTYLIVDPDANSIEYLQLDSDGTYKACVVETTIRLSVCGTCDFELDPKELFSG